MNEYILERIKKDIPNPYFDITRFENSVLVAGLPAITIERANVVKGIWVHTLQYSYDAVPPVPIGTITDVGATSRFIVNVQSGGIDSFDPHYYIYSNRLNFAASVATLAFSIGYNLIYNYASDLDPE